MSYALPLDLLARYDVRTLGDLVNDAGVRQGVANLVTDPVIQTMLNDAAGLVNTAIQQGNRITSDDITNLQTAGGTGWSMLVRLNCDLAYVMLCQRRGYASKELSLLPQWINSNALLEQLRKGERIFDLVDAKQAGVANWSFPGRTAYHNIQLMRTHNAQFFPLPPPQFPNPG
jgi:hypothetical protein